MISLSSFVKYSIRGHLASPISPKLTYISVVEHVVFDVSRRLKLMKVVLVLIKHK